MTERIRLLYAEDSRTDADLTLAHFAEYAPDFEVHHAESGEACLARLDRDRFDVLLLDNRLGDMEAVDVLSAISARTLSLPIVVATGTGDEELVVRVLRLGAWDYVAKSGDYIQDLPDTLRTALAEHRRRSHDGRAARRRHRRVLYVERHSADVDLTRRHFAEHAAHIDLHVTRSSQVALDLVQQTPFDLVMTDLRMPDMSALDLLRAFRNLAIDVPVVVVTGRGDEMAAVAALTLGAYDYVVKRDNYLTQLPHVVENAVDRHQLGVMGQRLQAELRQRERAEAERMRLTEELRQAQKIDSLGRLAGGVAHDFNNLLTVIRGHADLLLEDLHERDPMKDSVADIVAAATRAADLTRQLLTFSRRQLLNPRVIDLNALLDESTRMLKRLLGEDIELTSILAQDLAHIRADPGQIEQVIVNLAVNARDAMPRGGRLTIETRNVRISAHHAEQHPTFQPGEYVLLAMSDTGIGMDGTVLPHIFEPFFTTKEHGQGTGLGLSMVYGIVKQSGGWVWVYSEPNVGTSFSIYLPRVEAPVSTENGKHADVESPRGAESVLIVEDEETVRKLTCHVLRKYGYRIIEAANGGEALLACERRLQPIELLVTDVVMPGMSGPDLAARLRVLHPEMKVLYTSGYTDAAVVHHGLLERTLAFLQKPFTPNELARKVREVLDGSQPGT